MISDENRMESSNDTTAKAAIWIGVGCLALVVCLVGGAISGVGGLLWLTQAPDDVILNVNTPVQVDLGDQVLIEVEIVNNSAQTSELSSIDISMEYLDGIVISSSTPAFESTDQYESFGIVYQTYYFYQAIAPGESLTVTFTGEAITAGDYTGEIDVCIGSDFSCINNILRTVVR